MPTSAILHSLYLEAFNVWCFIIFLYVLETFQSGWGINNNIIITYLNMLTEVLQPEARVNAEKKFKSEHLFQLQQHTVLYVSHTQNSCLS